VCKGVCAKVCKGVCAKVCKGVCVKVCKGKCARVCRVFGVHKSVQDCARVCRVRKETLDWNCKSHTPYRNWKVLSCI